MQEIADPGWRETVYVMGPAILLRLPGHERAERADVMGISYDPYLARFPVELAGLTGEFSAEAV
jgi:hypothetical protein